MACPYLHSATMHDQQLSEQPTSGVETCSNFVSTKHVHPVHQYLRLRYDKNSPPSAPVFFFVTEMSIETTFN